MTALALVSHLLADQDEAIGFFVDRLGSVLTHDTPLGAGRRWVVVTPPAGGASLLIAPAAGG